MHLELYALEEPKKSFESSGMNDGIEKQLFFAGYNLPSAPTIFANMEVSTHTHNAIGYCKTR